MYKARQLPLFLHMRTASEQEPAQQHEHEEEEPYLMQRPLQLHVPPSLPRARVVRTRVVHVRRLRLATEHPWQHGHRHPPEHPSGRRVHHAAVPKRWRKEGVELGGTGLVLRLMR
uniref:Uncharacterized protein n=1 Tax=Arundo donax TaxID=35708 RepID=A0A0A9GJ87_ARUDO